MPTNTKYFSTVCDYARKADLNKGHWNPKTKLGVTMHFSEISKKRQNNYKAMYGIFSKIEA